MSQQYSLRWNNHQPNFISMFTTLLNTQTLVDVTLAAEGKHLQAHKVVLSACSTYFQALFVDNPSRHPIVILKDVSFADLRTMVDFMYYGEVNVTEEQLPQVLDTAKLLKIKGLTEMPDSTSLTRSQGTSADFQSPGDTESQRHSASPATSPLNKRQRRRKSSTGSTSLQTIPEDNRNDEPVQNSDLLRSESITLCNVSQQKKIKENQEDRNADGVQQMADPQNINIDSLGMDQNQLGLTQGGQWSMMEHPYPRYSNCIGSGGLQPDPNMYMNNVINHHMENEMNNYSQGISQGIPGPSPGPSCLAEGQSHQAPQATQDGGNSVGTLAEYVDIEAMLMDNDQQKLYLLTIRPRVARQRRLKIFKRQNRVADDRDLRKQTSEPVTSQITPALQKHESYPQYSPKKLIRVRAHDQEVGSLLIRTVSTSTATTSHLSTSEATGESTQISQRASHTPAVRSGPPLSCNFCWNTVDDCGRILRRKTQYHCPECRTNLCIVPCFHEYHDETL